MAKAKQTLLQVFKVKWTQTKEDAKGLDFWVDKICQLVAVAFLIVCVKACIE